MPGWLGKIGDFFSKDLFSISVWNYAISFVILVVAVFAKTVTARIVGVYLKKLVARTRFRLDDVLIEAMVRPVSWGVLLFGVYVALLPLGLTDKYEKFFGKAFETAVAVLVLVFLLRLVDGLAEYLKPKVAKTRTSLDDAILPAMRTAAKIFVLIVGVLGILSNLDYPIASILAGLGVGGLAVALAAQETLSNWFGAFMIFSDRPFTAGDRVVVGQIDGFIEQVGLRSTRIRTLEGTQV
ncbi:MAG: mechanosensitive ion channel, partial [Planctomycetes bacterium]|nr:mechanosensitive ion channel [Planctomycetota bacterium]